jgi:hypothetical protein
MRIRCAQAEVLRRHGTCNHNGGAIGILRKVTANSIATMEKRTRPIVVSETVIAPVIAKAPPLRVVFFVVKVPAKLIPSIRKLTLSGFRKRATKPTKQKIDLGQMPRRQRWSRLPHRRVTNGAAPSHDLLARRNAPKTLSFVVKEW